MIIDNISNAPLYYGLGRRLAVALRYLQSTDVASIELGRYQIEGDDVFVIVQEYDTKPLEGALWEAHRRYVDVQYIVSGSEKIGYAHLPTMKNMKIINEYNESKDILKMEGEGDFLLAEAGTFVILMPHDVHMPGAAVSQPAHVRKAVVKVLY